MAKDIKKEKEAKKPKKKRSVFLLFLASLFSVAVMMLIAGGVVLAVVTGTEEGRASVFRYFSAAILNTQGWHAAYGKIHSPNLREWKLEDIRLSRGGREKMLVNAIDMKLSYTALLKGTVAVERFQAKGFHADESHAQDAQVSASGLAGATTRLDASATALPLKVVMTALGRRLAKNEEGVLDAKVSIDGDKVTLGSLVLALKQGGRLEANGTVSADAFDVNVKGKEVPSQLFIGETGPVAPGMFAADLVVCGSFDAPEVSGTFGYAADLFYSRKKSVPVAVAAKLETQGEVLHVTADVTRSNSKAGRVELDIPLAPYLAAARKGTVLPLVFDARGGLDVEALAFLYDPAVNLVRGQLKADLKVGGTVAAPVVRGNVRFEKGRYRNALTGTDMHQIEMHLVANDTGAVIKTATATDGAKGRLSLEGDVRWKGGDEAANLVLKVREAAILKRPDMNGQATGGLSLRGSLRRLDLAGVMEISPLTVMLESALLADIPEIKVVDVAAPQKAEEPSALHKLLPAVHLNVTVKAEKQAYLRGRGMDVELAGKVTVTGTLGAPVYNGGFKTVRGECRVLGKRFVLKKGEVRFEESDMYLDVTAVNRAHGAQIQADLSGKVEKLNIKLSSVPSLPQDEILARLLFGAPAKSISPLQAARLAVALKQMKDGGSAIFDPVGAVRDRLGLDQLNVGAEETEEGQGVSVGAGKYIGDKIYLEVEKTPDPANPWKASAEIEINDNVSIETTTGANPGSQGVGIQWKRDY